ncbi:hemicentin-2-like [Bolinopsis microptera]|uniref:hemicentin-2-like n=1 Tax=Bolinopsis microptera TaxID=2820187 RepID=UPI0030797EC6
MMMLLILIPWLCNFAEGQYLSVIPVLEEVVALREGQTVTLSATLDHSSTVTISKFDFSWTKTSGSLPSDAQFIFTGTSSQLIINRVKIEDEGEYSVTVRGRRNDGGYIDKSAEIILTLLGQIKIEPEFPVKSVICCGAVVTLSVTINRDVEPGDVKWTREDSNWKADRYLPSSQNLELIISDIRESDSGTYVVEVTRDNFSGSAAILLLVRSKPKITGEVLVERSVGQSVYLQLTFNPVVDLEAITWFKDNKKIVDNLSSDGTQLQINNVKVEDSGVYTCIASNSVGTGQHTTQITITGIPMLEITPLSQHVTPGDKMQIYCRVTQRATLKWYLNDMELPNKVLLPRVKVYGSNPSYILILNFLPKHQGEYQCRTQSKLSNVQGSANVFMRDIPQLKNTTSRAVLVQQGGQARFSVDITLLSPRKSSEFSISWSRDGDEIQEYDTRYQFLDNSKTLKILSTDLSEEGGYSVEARNNNGSSTLHFYLTFSGRSSAPVVYNVVAPDTLLQGETVTLYCSVGGNPVPKVSWYFGNSLLTTSSVVVLSNVTSRDSGNYECRGSNSIGSGSATRYVKIRGTPRVTAKVSPLVENVGRTATLQVYVDVETYMNPLDTKLTWSRSDGNLIDSRVSYQDNMRKLVIYNTEEADAGTYIIRASNPEFNIRETSILLKITTENPVLSSPTMKQTSLVGSAARLLVVADALPRPDPSQIRWTRNNSMVVMTTVSSDGMSLILSDVQPTHTGVYRFQYLNSLIDMTLVVQQPPHIFRASKVQQTVAVFGEASFVCSFTGYPFPTVRWYQGYNELLNSNTRYEISPDLTVLKIRNVQGIN